MATNNSRNLITALIATVMLLAGFTISQLTIVGDVKINSQNITNINDSYKEVNFNLRKVIEQNTAIILKMDLE